MFLLSGSQGRGGFSTKNLEADLGKLLKVG
jgi:hypothetical protein